VSSSSCCRLWSVTWPLGVDLGVVVVVLSFVVGEVATWEVLGVVIVVMLSFVAVVNDIVVVVVLSDGSGYNNKFNINNEKKSSPGSEEREMVVVTEKKLKSRKRASPFQIPNESRDVMFTNRLRVQLPHPR
jgi:hypothetical protein